MQWVPGTKKNLRSIRQLCFILMLRTSSHTFFNMKIRTLVSTPAPWSCLIITAYSSAQVLWNKDQGLRKKTGVLQPVQVVETSVTTTDNGPSDDTVTRHIQFQLLEHINKPWWKKYYWATHTWVNFSYHDQSKEQTYRQAFAILLVKPPRLKAAKAKLGYLRCPWKTMSKSSLFIA